MSTPPVIEPEPVDITHAECIAARRTIHAAYQAARQRASEWEPAPYQEGTP